MATMLSLLSTLFANVSKQGVKYCFVVRATENYHAKGLPKAVSYTHLDVYKRQRIHIHYQVEDTYMQKTVCDQPPPLAFQCQGTKICAPF